MMNLIVRSQMKTKTNKFSKKQLYEMQNFAIELSQDAGKTLLQFQKKIHSLKVDNKQAQGVVSKADIATEKKIFDRIKKKYPSHHILGEENFYQLHQTSAAYEQLKNQEALWVVDPLDGTHNFLNGSDYYCISIALVHFGVPLIGVIHRPATGELFYAISSYGAFYVGPSHHHKKRKLFIDKNFKNIQDTIWVTGFASEKGVPVHSEFKLFKKLVCTSRGVRRFGSAALDICYVASGLWDGFFEKNLSPWDVAAAGLILKEAGGRVTNYSGENFHPFQSSIVGARPPLYKKIIEIINQN